jgi:site-specific DNA recombinase
MTSKQLIHNSGANGHARLAVIYARVSSKDQEREGFSMPTQLNLLPDYDLHNKLKIAQEFEDAETAKKAAALALAK